MVIWIVGLSGAGKTTIGREMFRLWKGAQPDVVLVDGDEIRKIFDQDKEPKDFTLQGRRKNALRIQEICTWLDRQSINIICCILCIFEDVMLQNRELFTKYFQIYIDTPMTILKERDPKGIYKRAQLGKEKNVVGFDLEFHPPSLSDMTISTDQDAPPPEILAEQILNSAGVRYET